MSANYEQDYYKFREDLKMQDYLAYLQRLSHSDKTALDPRAYMLELSRGNATPKSILEESLAGRYQSASAGWENNEQYYGMKEPRLYGMERVYKAYRG